MSAESDASVGEEEGWDILFGDGWLGDEFYGGGLRTATDAVETSTEECTSADGPVRRAIPFSPPSGLVLGPATGEAKTEITVGRGVRARPSNERLQGDGITPLR
jgi:hypothetical protein